MKYILSIAIVLTFLLSSVICLAERKTITATSTTHAIPNPVVFGDPFGDDKHDIHVCDLKPVGKVWRGQCNPAMDGNPVWTITRVEGITTGVWRRDVYPSIVWSGVMQTDGTDAIEIEVYDKGVGAIRTSEGWFPVSDFAVSPKNIQFKIDEGQEVQPSDLDREIVKRAAAILSTESNWNRNDNRRCLPTDKTWGIYCAMERGHH